MASIFQRLIGLETEYAAFTRAPEGETPPTKLEIYERMLVGLSRQIPTVRAHHYKDGAFLATGGAIWNEVESLDSSHGTLIEGSSPECRSPRELLAAQRAQDRLFERAAEAHDDVSIRLLKNCRDASGEIYGTHENYDAEFAVGWRLLLWRVGLVLLLPLCAATWLATFVFGLCLRVFEAFVVVFLVGFRLDERRTWLTDFLTGPERAANRPFAAPEPAWLERIAIFFAQTIAAPLSIVLTRLLAVCGFHRVRRGLVPFLVTRPIFSGAGSLDTDGNFQIAERGPGLTSVWGLGVWGDRFPLLTFGNFLKTLGIEACSSPRELLDLTRGRQRLQVGLGDSNVCETAEYLKLATTTLVLDAIEAGVIPQPPRLLRPIEALRTVCRDASLSAALPLVSGLATALEIQWFYCNACRRFVESQSNPPREARETVRLWRETLEALQDDPETLFGRVDWVTKRRLIERAKRSADLESDIDERDDVPANARDLPASLKKIDLKYHEQSGEGYGRKLERSGIAPRVTTDEEVDRAMRLPPSRTPAARRGRMIREFFGGPAPLLVNWKWVGLGIGPDARWWSLRDEESAASTTSAEGDADASREAVDRADDDRL